MASSANFLFGAALVVILPLVAVSAPEIQFSFGRIQGVDKVAYGSQKLYNAYYGIPFAEPPVGELRFRPPQPFAGRDPNVVISSDTFRYACLQSFGSYRPLNEDCLHLNVFTPKDMSTIKKVIVFIHGGGFVIGEASIYEPSQLVTDNDVIVVTTQYRLGPFGFLSTGSGDGNNGLRDQILGLRWVKDNIRQFGGDPDDITLMGESAGSSSVSYLCISPLTKGLFTKAIMQSGTVLTYWAYDENQGDRLYTLAKALGCSSPWFVKAIFQRDAYQNYLMDCVRRQSAEAILNQTAGIAALEYSAITEDQREKDPELILDGVLSGLHDDVLTYAPYADGEVVPKEPRLLVEDKEYLRRIGALDRSYVIGFVNNEALLNVPYMLASSPVETYTRPKAALKYIKKASSYMFPLSTSIYDEVLDLLEYEYAYPRDSEGNAPFQGLLDVTSDTLYKVPSILFARALTKASDQPNVFLDYIDHYPEVQPFIPVEGTAHALTLLYIFDPLFINFYSFYKNLSTETEQKMSDFVRRTIATFAKTGNPSRPSEGIIWPPYDAQEEYYLAISPTPEVRQHLNAKRVALWTDFLFKKGGVFNGNVRPRFV